MSDVNNVDCFVSVIGAGDENKVDEIIKIIKEEVNSFSNRNNVVINGLVITTFSDKIEVLSKYNNKFHPYVKFDVENFYELSKDEIEGCVTMSLGSIKESIKDYENKNKKEAI